MIVAWTFLSDIETEGDLILPRYQASDLARSMAKREAERTGRPQTLCKVVAVEQHEGSNEDAGPSG